MENTKLVKSWKREYLRVHLFLIIRHPDTLFRRKEIFHVSSAKGSSWKAQHSLCSKLQSVLKFLMWFHYTRNSFFSFYSNPRQMFSLLCSREWIIAISLSALYQSQVSSIENFSHLITAVILRQTVENEKNAETLECKLSINGIFASQTLNKFKFFPFNLNCKIFNL